MLDTTVTSEVYRERDDFCDIRVWSGECEHTTSLNSGDKYLCDVCETVSVLEHEVRPAALPYVSGDYDKLS
ncbi:MAG: hypothetical protein M0023_12560 [Desulfobacteraceae bacterium]|nr:hypothetical protein [Desulfobacteraceae bacterium]